MLYSYEMDANAISVWRGHARGNRIASHTAWDRQHVCSSHVQEKGDKRNSGSEPGQLQKALERPGPDPVAMPASSGDREFAGLNG